MSNETDPRRRLALQIALQLPANVAEARQVLELAGDVLDDFMIEGSSSAHRRARLLGWGAARLEGVEPQRPAAISPARVRAWSILWGLTSLAVTVPLGALLVQQLGHGAVMSLLLGVVVVALIFGAVPALVLSIASTVMLNLLLGPALAFQVPIVFEAIAAAGFLISSLLVPWLAERRGNIRTKAIKPSRQVEPVDRSPAIRLA